MRCVLRPPLLCCRGRGFQQLVWQHHVLHGPGSPRVTGPGTLRVTTANGQQVVESQTLISYAPAAFLAPDSNTIAGGSAGATSYSYPQLIELSPSTATQAGGDVITIYGAHLANIRYVQVDEVQVIYSRIAAVHLQPMTPFSPSPLQPAM